MLPWILTCKGEHLITFMSGLSSVGQSRKVTQEGSNRSASTSHNMVHTCTCVEVSM